VLVPVLALLGGEVTFVEGLAMVDPGEAETKTQVAKHTETSKSLSILVVLVALPLLLLVVLVEVTSKSLLVRLLWQMG
jgi:hypothetical protein